MGGSSRGGAGVGLLLARAYGYEWVPETGLYHVGARVYDPRTARWLQRDPIDAASGDPNLYRYCGNDPVNYRDPTGTEIQDEFTSVTCTRGRMEIVRMALEEAGQVGSIRATQWWTYGKEFFQHHIFPQRLREFFKKIGIDVDDCIISVFALVFQHAPLPTSPVNGGGAATPSPLTGRVGVGERCLNLCAKTLSSRRVVS